MEAPRVVVDTNVVIAGAINPYGSSGKILDLVANHAVISFTSPALLEELRFKLYHKKVLKYLRGRTNAEIVFRAFREASIIVFPSRKFNIARDRDDNELFSVAFESRAGYIISLDKKHVLSLRDEKKEVALDNHRVKVLRSAEFLEEAFPGFRK